MGFNLDDYETVAELNKWFQDNYPLGRQRVEIISDNPVEERMVIWAAIYRDSNDPHPAVENITRGRQSDYPRPMQRFYAEDLATSAIGRCIALLKGNAKTATKDDMIKVESAPVKSDWDSFVEQKPKQEELTTLDEATDILKKALGAEIVESKPSCQHGEMTIKEGTSKTGKPYRGYVCTWARGLGQCEPIWMKLSPQGTWYVPNKDNV